MVSAVLHNYLRIKNRDTYSPVPLMDREDIANHRVIKGNRSQTPSGGLENLPEVPIEPSRDAITVRDNFNNYFNSEGRVP